MKKRKRTTYYKEKELAMKRWEKAYFGHILKYYDGHTQTFIANAIQMDRPNFLRKLREHKLGSYAEKL